MILEYILSVWACGTSLLHHPFFPERGITSSLLWSNQFVQCLQEVSACLCMVKASNHCKLNLDSLLFDSDQNLPYCSWGRQVSDKWPMQHHNITLLDASSKRKPMSYIELQWSTGRSRCKEKMSKIKLRLEDKHSKGEHQCQQEWFSMEEAAAATAAAA